MNNPKDTQIGGDHYKKYAIQPLDYIVANDLSFLAGNAIKYITRYKDKNGAEDIRKAIHYLELLLEYEYKEPFGQQLADTLNTPTSYIPTTGCPACDEVPVVPKVYISTTV
jgi:hypothetical protein